MKPIVAVLHSLVLLVVLTPGVARAAERRPNILFLVADEFRHDCLGVAGHPIVKTPNFDKLAQDGVRFTQAYVAAPVCSPSRATLFTGRYPQVHGVTTNNMPFAPGEVVLPEILHAQGYTTGIVGKLHLQNHKGWFDYDQVDTEGSSAEYQAFLKAKGQSIVGRANTAAVPGSLVKKEKTALHVGTSVLPEDLFPEAWEADQAINFIRQQKGKDKPFFLYVSMLKPHSEFVVPRPFDTMYRAKDMLDAEHIQAGHRHARRLRDGRTSEAAEEAPRKRPFARTAGARPLVSSSTTRKSSRK